MKVHQLLERLQGVDADAEVTITVYRPRSCCDEAAGFIGHEHDGAPQVPGEIRRVDVWPASSVEIIVGDQGEP